MRNLIDITDLTIQEIDELIATACDIIANPDKYCDACRRKKLATLFFEPSTRTRLSFEAAIQRGKRCGYCTRGRLLCRHHRHASSQRRGAYGCFHALSRAHHQCR